MANVLTDPTVTFVAAPVWAATKINNTARADADSEFWVTANWANAVDVALKDLNSFWLGANSAGAIGSTATLLGSLAVGEDLITTGDATFGDYASALVTVDVHTTNTGAGHLRFGISGDDTRAGLSYSHTSDKLDIWSAGASQIEVVGGVVRPTSHNVTELGDAAHRWSEIHGSTVYARTAATVGGVSAAAVLTIDGNGPGNAPALLMSHAGVTQVTIESDAAGELSIACAGPARLTSVAGGLGLPVLTTAARVALVPPAAFEGLSVYDSDLDVIYAHDGTSWIEVGNAAASGPTRFECDCLAGDAVGDFVYVTGDEIAARPQVALVDITDPAKMPAWGVIAAKPAATQATVTVLGEVGSLAGLASGSTVWVSATGKPTTTQPIPGGQDIYLQAAGVAHDDEAFILNPQPTTIKVRV